MNGRGAFRIPLFDLDYDDREVEAVSEVVKSKWVSTGPKVREFERKFADFIGVRHAIAVSSGSAALHIAYLAAGIGSGDEVIVPSNTFIATVSMILHVGARPIFADIQSLSRPNISVSTVKGLVTDRTRAIVFLHYAGYTDNALEIRKFCDENDILMIEDAAHAHGSVADGLKAGSIGHIAAFSFYANKSLAIGEGGMVTTSDDGMAEKARLLRSHGMTSLSWDRFSTVGPPANYDIKFPGFNYRMSELHAALGLVQLQKLPRNNQRRRELVGAYRELLKRRLGGAVDVPFEPSETTSHYIMPIVLGENVDRDAVAMEMAKYGVQTSVHYRPVHGFSYFKEFFGEQKLPLTEAFGRRELTLPLYPSMRDSDIEFVVDALARSIELLESQ